MPARCPLRADRDVGCARRELPSQNHPGCSAIPPASTFTTRSDAYGRSQAVWVCVRYLRSSATCGSIDSSIFPLSDTGDLRRFATADPPGRGGRFGAGQQLGNLIGRHRLAIEVSLGLGAPLRAHLIQLLLSFDAFRRRGHAEALAKPGDRANDGDRVWLLDKVANKGSVDLDFVEWKTAEIAQRRVPSPEVIHRYPDAQATQLVQHGQRCIIIV